jgi:dTDP-4-dehydrorhamnose 3,5-epimerase
MEIRKTKIPAVFVIEPQVFEDERGFFIETYQVKKFAELGIKWAFVQDNHSGSRKGTLRGLHYQIRQPQGKLIRVISGEIFDVVVDLRKKSATFGKWEGEYLSEQNRLQLWVPQGFAHGFYVLSEWAEVVYKTTDYYAPEWERTLLWNDPAIGVSWPLRNGEKPLLSPKDAQGSCLTEADLFE